jgi:serine/threonine-protein kinase RsbW
VEQDCFVLRVAVNCDRAAPAIVREKLARVEGIGWILGDAMLVASELVTNAVLHSGGSARDLIEVTASRRDDSLVISVRDPGRSGKRAEFAPRDEDSIGGLGLRVVDAIAVDWGTERSDGYLVWAALPLTG